MDNLYHRMKVHKGDKLVKACCKTCEFNFGEICAGYGTRTDNAEDTFGMKIIDTKKMFLNGCDDYGISLDDFIKQEKLNNR